MTAAGENPILSGQAISALIPQKPPMEMVDKLWFNDEKRTVSGFSIKTENIFCENNLFTEPGIIENIAQTAALRTGYMASLEKTTENKKEPPIGYIGAIKNLKIHSLPEAGDELLTEVIIENIIFDVSLIKGKTTVKGQVIAECEMKIFLKKD